MAELQILRKSSEVIHSGRIVDSDDPLLGEKKVANYFQCLLECYCWCHKTKYCAEGDRTIFQSISARIHREWWKLRKVHNHRQCERSLPYSYKDLTKEPLQSCTGKKRSVLVDTKPCGNWRESVLLDHFNNRAALVISGYLSKWLVESALPSNKP